jgi:hypothetical protein
MGTTADKLAKLLDTKAAIKQAIVDKGQTIADEPFATYAGKIAAIEDGRPIELSTAAEMNAAMTDENVGKLYKFTGTTQDGGYIPDALYVCVEGLEI